MRTLPRQSKFTDLEIALSFAEASGRGNEWFGAGYSVRGGAAAAAAKRESNRRYYLANLEECRARRRDWYRRNRDAQLARVAEWTRRNPERRAEIRARYLEKLRAATKARKAAHRSDRGRGRL
jgi:hypothetical protein